MKTSKVIKRLPVWIMVTLVLVVMLYPIFWIFMSSFKPGEEQYLLPPYALPETPTFANYMALWDSMIPTYFKNSVIEAVITISSIVILGALAAYPLAKMEFKGRRVIKNIFMVGLMIPIFVSLIPLFGIYNKLHLLNTYWALVIPKVGFALPISIYLYMAFLEQIPDSLIEAGYMDGANSFQVYFHIIVPLMKNTMATVAIYQFVNVWNEFTFANTFISESAMKTIPVGLNDFINSYGLRDWGLTFAAVAVTVLPTLILFFILNKQVMSGMTSGAVKS